MGTGSSVRLHPSRRADAHDMFFDGMLATVAGVFHDVDGEMHVALTVDDDPATEALLADGATSSSIPTRSSPSSTASRPWSREAMAGDKRVLDGLDLVGMEEEVAPVREQCLGRGVIVDREGNMHLAVYVVEHSRNRGQHAVEEHVVRVGVP